MSDVVIQVDSLSKRYRLGMVGTRTLTHDFERWWARVRGKPDPYLKIGQEEPRKRLTTDYTDHTDKNSAPNPCKSVPSVVKTVPDRAASPPCLRSAPAFIRS